MNPTNKRLTRAEIYINSALLVSMRGTCQRAQVGAVIVKNNRIISSGYNGPASGLESRECSGYCDTTKSCTNAIHAEANAIYFAAKMGISLEGSEIYCTHSPCLKCAEAILQSGITTVNYLKSYRASDEAIRLLRERLVSVNEITDIRYIVNTEL